MNHSLQKIEECVSHLHNPLLIFRKKNAGQRAGTLYIPWGGSTTGRKKLARIAKGLPPFISLFPPPPRRARAGEEQPCMPKYIYSYNTKYSCHCKQHRMVVRRIMYLMVNANYMPVLCNKMGCLRYPSRPWSMHNTHRFVSKKINQKQKATVSNYV